VEEAKIVGKEVIALNERITNGMSRYLFYFVYFYFIVFFIYFFAFYFVSFHFGCLSV
jgi:hypothetical protein